MRRRYSANLFRKILVPVVQGAPTQPALRVGLMVAEPADIVVAGIIATDAEAQLSAAAVPARQLRLALQALGETHGFNVSVRVRASYRPWEELMEVVGEEQPELLVIGAEQLPLLKVSLAGALQQPPCDTLVAREPLPERPSEVLCALRGGPFAELALRLGLAICDSTGASLTALHVGPKKDESSTEPAFKGVDRVLQNLPEVRRRYVATSDPGTGILQASQGSDVLVLGATAQAGGQDLSVGPVAEAVLARRSGGVIVVKSSRPVPPDMTSEVAGQRAISVLVDKWFAENTYHAAEFADLRLLAEEKQRRGLSVSVALPALNEEQTVAHVIGNIRHELMQQVPLVDELVLMDSNSTDRTRELAHAQGVTVHIHQKLLPALGARKGKGEALWKSLLVTRGDLLIWVDTDIANFHPRFVYGLLGPLITHPEIQFVKGFYRRPLRVDNKLQAGGGGRVTELTARPLLNLFFPELSGIIQPLSGEYGGRRSALEQMAFSSGYGVEIGLLIDVFERFGLGSIAQVDLQERIHHNQPLESLSKMSFAIIQTVMRRIERRYRVKMLEDVNKTMKLIRYGKRRLLLDVDEIAELERPPMVELEDYRALFRERFGD